MLNLPTVVKSIAREWRSGELTLLFIALIIAVACVSAMNNFAGLVRNQLEQGAATMLGADAVLSSSTAIDPAWLQKANTLGIKHTITLTFQSMVGYQNQLQLAQIKAITTPYPLRGGLKIANKLSDSVGSSLFNAPEPGTVWLNPRLFPLLAIDMGKMITIGATTFKVSGVIKEEPGQTGNWFSLSPRILMNSSDVAKTNTLQPGSIKTYNLLLKGSKEQLNDLHLFLKDKLNGLQEWRDSQNNILTVTNTINRSLSYLNFATLMSLVLAAVAISMASLRYCQRHLKQVALLRCFGASQALIIQLYLGGIAILGIIACLIGSFIGYCLQPLLIKWLGGLLPYSEHPFTLGPFFLSMLTGMVLLFCFSTGTIWQLRKVSAISLFRQQQLLWKTSTYFTYGLALFLLGIMAYYYTHSLRMTLAVLAGCLLFIAVALAGLWLIFGMFIKTKIRIPLNWRFGFNNIARNLEDSALQVIGIGLALTTLLSLMLLKNHLISDWQQQLSPQTPNYFIFNIEPEQKTVFNNLLENNSVKTGVFYPIVRGRLSAINNVSVTKLFGEEAKNINALQRELNLSWSSMLPADNHVTDGSWTIAGPNQDWVSVEQGVAKQLKLKLGDTLQFSVNDKKLNAQVRSIRQVDWTSFKPNFFMLFKPGLLDELPKTMLTSFYLPPDNQNVLINITKQFPNVSLIDIAQTINKIQVIMTNAGNALTLITLFALLVGLVIVTLAILSLSGTKQQETQVLKVLGMRRNTLLWVRSSEAFMIGLYSGFLATGTSVLINLYIVAAILDGHFSIPWILFMVIPVGTAFLVVLINLIIQGRQYQGKIHSL
jgi:putative ABC transport system permease protein